MKGGRRKTPSVLQLLRGNPGKRRINHDEPKPEPGVGAAPEALDGEALKEWHRLGPQLETLGLLTAIDVPVFIAYCQQWGRYIEAEANVSKIGEVVKAPSGYPIINPYLSIANKAYKQCREFWSEFGMTAAARSRISVKPRGAGSVSPLAKYLKHG
jgi:P27 family predicted phage terminase small subunit